MTEAPKRIVFLDRSTIPPTTKLRALSFAHELKTYEVSAPETVAERIRDADIVITNKARIPDAAMAGAAHLKCIAVAATGIDVVDVAAARARGIVVSNIRNYAAHTVPEHTFALLLALRRNVIAYRQSVVEGRWQQSGQFCYFDFPIRDLAGSNIGIIGGGALGSAVAKIAHAFGMTVLQAEHKGAAVVRPGYVGFAEVLHQADVLTLHLPLKPETRGLIGAAEFAQMRRKPLLINTARGGIVDEHALVTALEQGQIAGAGFDVTSTEPPPADHVFMKLLAHPNFILTPHVAWASEGATQSLADQLMDNIEAFVAGTPRNVV